MFVLQLSSIVIKSTLILWNSWECEYMQVISYQSNGHGGHTCRQSTTLYYSMETTWILVYFMLNVRLVFTSTKIFPHLQYGKVYFYLIASPHFQNLSAVFRCSRGSALPMIHLRSGSTRFNKCRLPSTYASSDSLSWGYALIWLEVSP